MIRMEFDVIANFLCCKNSVYHILKIIFRLTKMAKPNENAFSVFCMLPFSSYLEISEQLFNINFITLNSERALIIYLRKSRLTSSQNLTNIVTP